MRTVQDCDEKSMHLSVQRKPLKIWRIVISLCVCRCTCVSMHTHSLIMFYRVSLSFFSIYISLAGLSISDSCAVSSLCPPDSCWDTGMCCCIQIYMSFGSLNSVLALACKCFTPNLSPQPEMGEYLRVIIRKLLLHWLSFCGYVFVFMCEQVLICLVRMHVEITSAYTCVYPGCLFMNGLVSLLFVFEAEFLIESKNSLIR